MACPVRTSEQGLPSAQYTHVHTVFSLLPACALQGGKDLPPNFFQTERGAEMSEAKKKFVERNEFRELVFSGILLGLLALSFI